MQSFKALIDFAKKAGKKRCVVVLPQDEIVLEGIKKALELDLIMPVLIGNKERILPNIEKVDIDIKQCVIEDVPNDDEALQRSIATVKEQGDFLMKGMLPTSTFLKGVLNKDWGMRTGNILSHIAVLQIPGYHKLIFMSDGGMNPKLNTKVRVDIIKNAVGILINLGIEEPKIGLIAASETVHPDMPGTTYAITIVDMNTKGEIKNCIIEGPFGFDVAISSEAAKHKKIVSRIAGDVDFLLMPNISAANIWAKGLIFFAKAKAAGMVAGATNPVIMLSRADRPETKLNSIALGVALSSGSGLNI
jgi:phosphate butyryltransferase